jgi:hypothetical protein
LKDISGGWDSSTITITDVIMTDEFKKKAAEDGCDFSELEAAKGQPKPMSIGLNPSGENGGTLNFGVEGEDSTATPFTYADGKLSASLSQEGATVTMDLDITDDGTNYIATGKMVISYMEGNLKILADINATKKIPTPPAATPPVTSTPAQ